MTEPREATIQALLELHGLRTPEDLEMAVTCYQGYMAISLALLDRSGPAIDFLRGIGRAGMEAPPRSEWGKKLQHDVLRTLQRLKAKPLTREEFIADATRRVTEVVEATTRQQQGKRPD